MGVECVVEDDISDRISTAIQAMEIVYSSMSYIFDYSDQESDLIPEDFLRALMLGAFDLRNGLHLCAQMNGGVDTGGLDNEQFRRPVGGSVESNCGCGSGCSHCSEWGECVGGDLCPKENS